MSLAMGLRHIQVAVGGRDINVEVYHPDSSDPAPGILYLHEIYGVTDAYRCDARELAKRGYVVYLPDLYGGDARGYCVRAIVHAAGRNNRADNPLLAEINLLLDALKADPACNGMLGMLGMCLTGGFVIQAAMRPDLQAPVVYHHSFGLQGAGVPYAEEDKLQHITRLQGHWSRIDPFCPARRRQRLIQKLGDKVDAHLYNIPHGFRSVSRKTRAADLAWQRTLAFYDEHLRLEPAPAHG